MIKLLDVQLSVKANLDKVSGEHQDNKNEDSDAEEDPEEVEWNHRMLYQINRNGDTY